MKNKCLVHKLAKLVAITTISPETKELRSANLVTDVLVGGMAARRTSRTMRSTFEPFEFGHDARESGRSRMSRSVVTSPLDTARRSGSGHGIPLRDDGQMVGEGPPGGSFRGASLRSCLATIPYGAASPLASAMMWDVVRRGGDPIVTESRLFYLEMFVSVFKH